MHTRTEDLLTLRDGEPVDAAIETRLRAAPETAHEVGHLERMRAQLRSLPELVPPEGTWARIELQLERGETPSRRAWGPLAARAVGAAAAIVLVVLAGFFVTTLQPLAERNPVAGGVREGAGNVRVGAGVARADAGGVREGADARVGQDVINELRGAAASDSAVAAYLQAFEQSRAQSLELERVLGSISFQRPVMAGSTASAIVNLEDQIAGIEAVMATRGLPVESLAKLMDVRVDLLGALVQVRLAQAQPMPF